MVILGREASNDICSVYIVTTFIIIMSKTMGRFRRRQRRKQERHYEREHERQLRNMPKHATWIDQLPFDPEVSLALQVAASVDRQRGPFAVAGRKPQL